MALRHVVYAVSALAVSVFGRPNIIVIVADDLGWHDVGFSGSNITTPNIDKFAAEGVRLAQYYGQPVCSPSRAAMMTGRYPIAYGLQTYVIDPPGVDYGLNLNETLLPQLLKQYGGYQTHAVGKWHMGMSRWEYTPTFRGFNSFHGFYSGGQDYDSHVENNAFDLHIDSQPNCGHNCSVVDWANQGTYSTELYASSAVSVIQAHDPSQGPLFLYLPFQAVHSPDEVPQRYIDPYNNTIPNVKRRTFAGMLSALDEGIGNVTAALAARGMLDDTLVWFTADNGGPITEPNCNICGDSTGTTNYPLRGGKHSLWEGGVRLTAAVWGSMLTNTGVNRTGLMHHVDLLPTLLDAAGVTLPPGATLPLHGASQWPMIQTGAPSTRQEVLLNIDPMQPYPYTPPYSGNAALIQGNWKLQVGQTGPPWGYMPEAFPPSGKAADAEAAVAATGEAGRYWTTPYFGVAGSTTVPSPSTGMWGAPPILWPLPNMTTQLFDLSTDPYESNDVSGQHPSTVALMLDRLAYWATTVQVQPLYWNSTVDPRSNPSLRNGTWTPWLD